MTLKYHVEAIEKHTYKGIIDKVIYSSTNIDKETIKTYQEDKPFLVKNDYPTSTLVALTKIIITDDVRVRHDEKKI